MMHTLPLGAINLLNDPTFLFLVGLSALVLFFWYFASEIDRRKRNIGSALVAGIVILSLFATIPPKDNLKGGVDIQGGVAFTLSVQPGEDDDGKPLEVRLEDTRSAIATLRQRLNPDGTKDLFISAQGVNRIILQMPGITEEEANNVQKVIEKTAKLELREVHPQNSTLAPQVKAGKKVPGYRLYTHTFDNDIGEEIKEDILLSRRIGLDGSFVKDSYPDYATKSAVIIDLNGEGGKRMNLLTKNMRPGFDRIAVVLDGVVKSAPVVQSVPLGKRFNITGLDGIEEAKTLAEVLDNPLKNPLKVEERRQVSATYGASIVKQGVLAGIIGLSLTIFFVLAYYRFAGVVAIIALVINIIILFGTMAMFGFTFTMPGIAGIILTIGMAVDANVIIYERLREEIEAGKSVKNAISAAFDKAFSAIFDANITTLIIAIILFWLASDTVKGFAMTLTIGILASMFSALLAVRVLFWWFTGTTDQSKLKKLSFMDIFPNSKIWDFLSKRSLTFIISAALIVISLGAAGMKGNNSLGVDFTGGSLLRFSLGDQVISTSEAESAISDLDLSKKPFFQEETIPGTGELLTVRCAKDDAPKVLETLRAKVPALADIDVSTTDVSATLGKEFLVNSLIALGVGLFCILGYITFRFEFSFALGAFIAVFHDLIISVGIILLLGTELSLIHVGAFLTIIGYSINDTIIVFDRIRENLLTKRGDISEIMNLAISNTLSRTILTSVTTFISVLVLFIFGGSGLRDFSLTIMIGVIVGTYSSIFIASPIVYLWSKKNGTNLRKEVLDAQIQVEVDPKEEY